VSDVSHFRMPDVPNPPDVPNFRLDEPQDERLKAYVDALVALAPELDQGQRDRLLLVLRRALQREGPTP
jgi:hypothetical protein